MILEKISIFDSTNQGKWIGAYEKADMSLSESHYLSFVDMIKWNYLLGQKIKLYLGGQKYENNVKRWFI